MKNNLHFTKKSLEAISVPTAGLMIYHDNHQKALKLRVQSSGTKTFFISRRINGKPERITIGQFPEINVEQARKQADLLNAKIANGINPNEERQAKRNIPTLQMLFEKYLEQHAKPLSALGNTMKISLIAI